MYKLSNLLCSELLVTMAQDRVTRAAVCSMQNSLLKDKNSRLMVYTYKSHGYLQNRLELF